MKCNLLSNRCNEVCVVAHHLINKSKASKLRDSMVDTDLYIICWLMQPPPVWDGGVGYVSKGMMEAHFPPPAEDIQVTLLKETVELCLGFSPLSILLFSESRARAVPLGVFFKFICPPRTLLSGPFFIGIVSGCHLMSWHPGLSQGKGLVNHGA